MCLTCCDCGATIQRAGCRGRPPKRCGECKTRSRHATNRKRPRRGEGKHVLCCKACGVSFRSCRTKQRYCTKRCAGVARRRRVIATCERSGCGKQFETKPGRLAEGHRFCCRECSYIESCVCQNPACGKAFRPKWRSNSPWKGKNKYCCRDCYADHRFGIDRPRRSRPESHVRRSSEHALARSLRARCKQFGVTFDPACTREAVLARDKNICQKCGIKCNNEYKLHPVTRTPHPRNAEHDHIIPLSVLGSPGNVFENSQCLCRKCNSQKRDTPEGQLRLCLEEEAWGSGVRVRHQRSSKSLGETLAAVL
jgi:hypothetical protein